MDTEKTIEALLEFVTEKRRNTLETVLSNRTRYISVMLENIYQPHNASAVLRSCDAFGVQDIHIIEEYNKFRPSSNVSKGSSKWVTLHRHTEGIKQSYDDLRKQGYKIFATSLKDESNTLDNFVLDSPSILVFGNEANGLSDEAIEEADSTLYIPMFGFVESFNISVSVAIVLSHIITRLHNSDIDWKLKEEEARAILLQWLRSDVHKSDEIEQRFFK